MFEYKEMKTLEVADYTQITQCKHSKGGVHIIMSTFKHFQKYNKILSNVHKIGGTHLQCVNTHYAKFEYKEMKTVEVADYTQITQCKYSKGGVYIIMSTFKHFKNIIKSYQMCTK